MTSTDIRWGEVLHLQQQLLAAPSASETWIEAAIDCLVAAIAAGEITDLAAAHRAADNAGRRERHRRHLLRVHLCDQTVETPHCSYDHEQIEVVRDAARRVMAMMGRLDSAIVVAIAEGETAAGVAAATGLGVAAVRQRACRARARARELLAA